MFKRLGLKQVAKNVMHGYAHFVRPEHAAVLFFTRTIHLIPLLQGGLKYQITIMVDRVVIDPEGAATGPSKIQPQTSPSMQHTHAVIVCQRGAKIVTTQAVDFDAGCQFTQCAQTFLSSSRLPTIPHPLPQCCT